MAIDVEKSAQGPKKVRTSEGQVEERSVRELIEADRYSNSQRANRVPWGLRFARTQPSGINGRS